MAESSASRQMTTRLPRMTTTMLFGVPARVKTTIIMLAWTMTNAPTRKNEIVLDR